MLGKTSSRKADQSAKPVNAIVHGWCMSMAISWANKMEYAKRDILVSFPISSHNLATSLHAAQLLIVNNPLANLTGYGFIFRHFLIKINQVKHFCFIC